jgi:Carbohydrate (N-acetylglucosamine 6-O) sulfotransferase 5.
MWKKFDVYRESPSIEFQYRYLVLFESHHSNPLSCDSFNTGRYCQEFQVHESDLDRDDRADTLTVKIRTVLPASEPIYAVHVFLPIEYKITVSKSAPSAQIRCSVSNRAHSNRVCYGLTVELK